MNKEGLIKAIKNYQSENARNRMGCSEDWYVFIYAMKESFSIEEIENMTEHEIELLSKLHENVAEGLY